MKYTFIHECGHLLFFLKGIQMDSWSARITRQYNRIASIKVHALGGSFSTFGRYLNDENKLLLYLGGAIVDQAYGIYDSECYKTDFKYSLELGYSLNDIEKIVYTQAKLLSQSDKDFIDDMINTFYIPNYSKSHFEVSLKQMDEVICKHFPIFKNRMYQPLYKI